MRSCAYSNEKEFLFMVIVNHQTIMILAWMSGGNTYRCARQGKYPKKIIGKPSNHTSFKPMAKPCEGRLSSFVKASG